MKYAVHVEGDANLAQAIGLCELAKPSIQEMYEGQYAEEEEDDGQD